MDAQIILTQNEATEIFKALSGIVELLKALPSTRQSAPAMYAIMSNLAIIRMNLAGVPPVNSN